MNLSDSIMTAINMNQTNSMLIFSYIADYILAVVAIVSLFLSISSSRKISQELTFLKNGIIQYTEPIIKVTQHAWIKNGIEPFSATNLPIGIQAILTNASSVPAQVTKSTLKVFYGDLELNEIVKDYSGKNTKFIVGVHESFTMMNLQGNKFREYIKDSHRFFQEPSLTIHVIVEYSSLKDNRKFVYKTKRIIEFDARDPESSFNRAVDETIDYL